jgi:predicted amidohydrolase
VDHNRDAAEAGIRDAAANGARLVVLPEMWTTSFTPQITDTLLAAAQAADQHMIALSRELGIVIVGGGLHAEDGKHFNRALLVENGTERGEYRKIHLFSPNAEHRLHSPGSEPLVVDTRLGRIGVAICYDIRFPELIRYYFYRKTELLAVPAQWPEARAEHWRALLRARAIENEMFVAGCNRIGVEDSLKNDDHLVFPGDSRIVDPMGEILAAGAGEPDPLVADIELRNVRLMRRILPVSRDRRPDLYWRLWNEAWSRVEDPK